MQQQLDTNPESRFMDVKQQALPSGMVTFMLTDIESSTRLWEAESEGMAIAVARHYEILDTAIARHAGVRPVEQGEGDSVVAVFVKAFGRTCGCSRHPVGLRGRGLAC